MTPRVLRAHILPLPADTPRHVELERAVGVGVGDGRAWYRHQKEHWLGWLAEYGGPGAYGRTPDAGRDAAYVYNHIQCAPMLFWLSEALRVDDGMLGRAFAAVIAADPRGASQCAALRRVLPWGTVEAALADWPYSRLQKLRIRAAFV